MSALALGLCGGCLVGGILFAPYFRRSGSADAGRLPGGAFRLAPAQRIGRAHRRGGAVSDAGRATLDRRHDRRAGRSGIGRHAALVTAALLMLLPPLLGGMRGVTATALVQFLLALVALVGCQHLDVGGSHRLVAADRRLRCRALQRRGRSRRTANGRTMRIWNDAGLTLCVALGSPAFPALLIRSATARSSASARSSIAWTLLVVAIFCGARRPWRRSRNSRSTPPPARRLRLFRCSMPRPGFRLGRQGRRPRDALRAAGQGRNHCSRRLRRKAICARRSRDRSGYRHACRARHRRPAAACLDAACRRLPRLDAGGGIAGAVRDRRIARARSLFPGLEPRAPVSRRLLAQRLWLLLAAGLATYVAANPPADYLQLALWSLSLAAAGLFPALVLAIWWKRANRWGALSGMISGFAVAAYLDRGQGLPPRSLLSISNRPGWPKSCGRSAATGSCLPRFRSALSWRSLSAW